MQTDGSAGRIAVLETKGDQLDNLDTDYKRNVLTFLTDNFAWDDCAPAGELELVKNTGETVHCELVLMSEWKTRLPTLIGPPESLIPYRPRSAGGNGRSGPIRPPG